MKTGKHKIIQNLTEEAAELREWMYAHSSPDTPLSEFLRVANRYAIVCTRMYIIEKQW